MVLWAVAVAGVHTVPAPTGPVSGLRVWGFDAPSGEGSVTTFRPLVHPLIAELPVRGEGAAYRGSSEVPGPPVVYDRTAWAGASAGTERAASGAPTQGPARAHAFVVTGAERCRRFCVYRLGEGSRCSAISRAPASSSPVRARPAPLRAGLGETVRTPWRPSQAAPRPKPPLARRARPLRPAAVRASVITVTPLVMSNTPVAPRKPRAPEAPNYVTLAVAPAILLAVLIFAYAI